MKRGVRWTGGGLLLGLLALVATALWIRRPQPLPNPNGYDRLLALAATVPAFELERVKTNQAQLAELVQSQPQLLEEVLAAHQLPSVVPVQYSRDDLKGRMNAAGDLRRLEKAILARAILAELKQRTADGVTARLAGIELGQKGSRGGLMIDFMVGSAIQMYGLAGLSNQVRNLDAETCQRALNSLRTLREEQEPLTQFERRERRWMLWSSGWWKDFDTARELIASWRRPAENVSLFGTPAGRHRDLQKAYLETEAALEARLNAAKREKPSGKR